MSTLLRTIEFLSLSLWLGSDVFLSFVVAPGRSKQGYAARFSFLARLRFSGTLKIEALPLCDS